MSDAWASAWGLRSGTMGYPLVVDLLADNKRIQKNKTWNGQVLTSLTTSPTNFQKEAWRVLEIPESPAPARKILRDPRCCMPSSMSLWDSRRYSVNRKIRVARCTIVRQNRQSFLFSNHQNAWWLGRPEFGSAWATTIRAVIASMPRRRPSLMTSAPACLSVVLGSLQWLWHKELWMSTDRLR